MKPVGRRPQMLRNEELILGDDETYGAIAPRLRKPNQINQTITHRTTKLNFANTLEWQYVTGGAEKFQVLTGLSNRRKLQYTVQVQQ